MSCESWDSNATFDVVPFPTQDNHMNPIALYLGERIEEYLTHPYASPLFGEFKGLPPLLIQVGDAEVLRDEITLLAHKATLAGVDVRHELFEDAVRSCHLHQFPSFIPCLDPCVPSISFPSRHTTRIYIYERLRPKRPSQSQKLLATDSKPSG